MSKYYRFWILVFTAIVSIALSIPSLFDTSGKKITLGLDLQGGMNLLLNVNLDEVMSSRLTALGSDILYDLNEGDFLIDSLKVRGDHIEINILDKKEMEAIKKKLEKFSGLNILQEGLRFNINFTPEELARIQEEVIEQAVGTIRKRLNSFGLDETVITRQGRANILVEVPGKSSAEDEERIRNLISKPSHLKFMAVDEDRNARVDFMSEEEADGLGDVILPFVEDGRESKLLLKKIQILDGSSITSASPTRDRNNEYVVSFTLDSHGAKQFGKFTTESIGKRLAIVLDDKVYSAPVIRARITDSGQISGNFSKTSASDLAITLKSGALPASMGVVEKRSVGPSLGADSIKASLIALISGFALVVAFMIIYYNLAGVIACVALVVNIFMIVAVMALFGATLTLPGMAGIVLTIGMAVDANIIINERVRERLRAGDSVSKSIELGYSNASRAIFDSNITTLLAALLLYAYGTGSVQGFAITLSLGIIASILTAIVGTHGIYEVLMNRLNRTNRINLWFGIKRK